MAFSNPVVGGGGALVRDAIHSRLYQAGVQGWSINRDGTAEFQNALIRGEVEVGPVSPDPRILMTPNIPPELATFNPPPGGQYEFVVVTQWFYNATDYYWEALGYFNGDPSFFTGMYDTSNGVNVISRLDTFNVAGSIVTAYGTGLGVGLNSQALEYWFGGFGNRDVHIVTGESRDVGWGIVCADSITGGTVLTTVAEAAIAAANWSSGVSPSVDFRDGRDYRLDLDFTVFAAALATNQFGRVRVRRGNASVVGQILGTWESDVPSTFATATHSLRCYIRNATGADITSQISVTLEKTNGAAANLSIAGSAAKPINLTITDLGRTARSGITGLQFVTL